MEAVGAISTRSLLACGKIGAAKRSSGNVAIAQSTLGVANEGRVRKDASSGGGSAWEMRNLVFASVVSGLASVPSALADAYEEVVGSATEAAAQFDVPDVDAFSLTDFVSSNPLAILGGGAALALPLILSTVFKGPEGYGTVSAKDGYAKLGDKQLVSQILDIRVGDDIKVEGTPDLKAYKKRVTQLPYTGEPGEYLVKVLKKFKDVENTTIFVLDRFDGNSATVAKLLAQGGFKAAYAIKDGSEGPSGWQTCGLPWLVPRKGFSLDLSGFSELLSTSDSASVLPTTLGVAAAAGVGLVVFSEAETALQLVGSVALAQLFLKKFLFAKDRKKTYEELRTFLDTKVAPKELVDELKGIAGVLVPKFEEVQAASANGAAVVQNTLEAAPASFSEAVAAESPPPVGETLVEEPAPMVEQTAEASTSSTELPRTPNPLSPYAQYPGLKPPTTPTPSRP